MPVKGGTGAGAGRGAGDVRAGGAFFEIYAKDGLSGVLDMLKRKVTAFASFMRRVGTGLIGAGTAAGAGPLSFLVGGVNRATEIGNLSRQLQLPIQLVSRLKYAADSAGVSIDEVMNDTRGRFSDLLAQAPGLDANQARQALEIQKQLRDVTIALEGAMLPLLGTLVPLAQATADWIKRNAEGIAIVGVLATATIALGVAIYALTTPIGLVVAAGGGLVYLFRNELRDAFSEFAETAKTTWGAVSDALETGDIALAARSAFAGLKVEWAKLVLYWTDRWGKFKGVFVDGWHDIVLAVKLLWTDLAAFLGGKLFDALSPIFGGAAKLAKRLGLDELAADLNSLASINSGTIQQGRDKVQQQMFDERKRQQSESNAARQRDHDQAQADVDKAMEELAGLRQRAGFGALFAAAGGSIAGGVGTAQQYKLGVQQAFIGSEMARGGFSAFAAQQQFGVGGVKQMTELQKQLLDEVKDKLPEKIGNAVFNGFKVR